MKRLSVRLAVSAIIAMVAAVICNIIIPVVAYEIGGYRDMAWVGNGTDETWLISPSSPSGPLIITPIILSTVTTEACTGFDSRWAIVNGSITAEGMPTTVSQVGFDYGETATFDPSWLSWTETVDHYAGDEFWADLTGLSAGTQHFFRAKAFNGLWGYGDILPFSTKGSPTMYEYLNAGGDGNSDDIYEAAWTAMQFDVGAITHTVTSVRVPLKRTLLPGDVTLSIYHANAGDEPTGSALTSKTLDGDVMSTAAYVWYDFDVPDITLEASSAYAIVIKATSGTAANYIEWQHILLGGLANAVACHSTDSGITWIDDDPIDMLFEIWGEPVIDVLGANVFTGFRETGDWIIPIAYENYYVPYYPAEAPEKYFYLQLLDDTVVKAQTNCLAWGMRPGSLYISATQAATLEWGAADYKIRLYGDFTGNPTADYPLLSLDWRGAEMSFLDKWVILFAGEIATKDGVAMTTAVAGTGDVLNARGQTIFVIGIPYLDTARADTLFQLSLRPVAPADKTHTVTTTDLGTKIGADMYNMLEDWGNLFGGVSPEDYLGAVILILAAILIVVSGILIGSAGIVLGTGIGYLGVIWGTWVGAIDWAILGLATFAAAAIFVWTKFASK